MKYRGQFKFMESIRRMLNDKEKKVAKSFNGRWKNNEHQRFLKGLQKYGRDWLRIQKLVKTRTITQVRSHAQKFFANMTEKDIEALIDKEQGSENQQSSFDLYMKNQQNSTTRLKISRTEKRRPNKEEENSLQETLQEKEQKKVNLGSLKTQGNMLENELENYSMFMTYYLDNLAHFQHGGTFLSMVQGTFSQKIQNCTALKNQLPFQGMNSNQFQRSSQ